MDSAESGGRQNSLEYMAEMLGQLQAMAKAEGLQGLAYLIGMAHEEAAELVRRSGQPSSTA